MDVFVALEAAPPLCLQKQRGGPLVPTNLPPGRVEGTALALGDVNNDSRTDLLVAAAAASRGSAARRHPPGRRVCRLDLPGLSDLRLGGLRQ